MDEWTPEDLADLTVELRTLLNEWDPRGYGANEKLSGDYDGLNGSTLTLLASGYNQEDFSLQFAKAAEGMAGEVRAYEFADKLYVWFHSKTPPSSAKTGSYQRPQLRKGRRWRSSHWNR